jgi:hypothetical protein
MLPAPVKAFLRYLRCVLKGLDLFANTVIGGVPRETISEGAARLRDKGVLYGCVMCKLLDLFEKDHCSIVRDKLRATRGSE